jgi:hypothetical protein
LTNNSVFNQSNSPLYTQSTNTYLVPGIENGPAGDAAKSGAFYIFSSGSVSVGSGASLLIQVANPSGSGKTLYMNSLLGGVTGAATVNVLKGGTLTGGTTPTPFNANFGSSNTSVATARQNTGSLTGASTGFLAIPLTAGMYFIEFGGGIVVPANQTLSVTVGTGALTASAVLSWWEY